MIEPGRLRSARQNHGPLGSGMDREWVDRKHGVAEVSLYEEDRLIYGPMSLHP